MRMAQTTGRESLAREVLAGVPDPEIPVLTILDLGIVRHIVTDSHGRLRIGITPTYSGCPATEVIHRMVREALDEADLADAVVEEVLSPPWTSDWLSPEGRAKLRAFGIAPPEQSVANPRHLLGQAAIICPRCGSRDTQRLSEFGSTPCKAHYRCAACLEPFDHFKCI
jgi:ring-1,2-phenylacetyl-CoA epoxidase subunit PaaD